MTEEWDIVPSYHDPAVASLMQHSNEKGLCGYVCKVKGSESFYCYGCGTKVPQMYDDVILLGKIHIIKLDRKDVHWSTPVT